MKDLKHLRESLKSDLLYYFDLLQKKVSSRHEIDCNPEILESEWYQSLIGASCVYPKIELIQEKIEKWKQLPGVDHEHDVNSYLIHLHLLYYRCIFEPNFDKKLVILKIIEEMSKPFSRSKKGIWIYASCLKYMHVVYHHLRPKCKKALKKLNEAKRAIDWYNVYNGRPYWSVKNLLEDSNSQENSLDFLMCKIMFSFWTYFTKIGDNEGRKKCIVGSVRLLSATLPLKILSILNYDELGDLIKFTFNLNRLKQAEHFLVGTWHHLTELKKSLKEKNRSKLNVVEAKLCQIFSDWGVKIAFYSMKVFQHGLDVIGEFDIDNDSYVEIEEFKVAGVEQYLNEFPLWPGTNLFQAKAVLNRAKKWSLKAIQLLYEVDSEQGLEFTQKRMASIEKLNNEIDKIQRVQVSLE